MNMENVRIRAISVKPDGKNYLVRAIEAMVRKVEDNKTRAQFWATLVLTVSMAFFPWLGYQLVEFGRNQARQEMLEKQTKSLNETIDAQKKEIESLKKQVVVEPEENTNTPAPKKRTPQTAGNRRNRLNSAVQNNSYAGGLVKFGKNNSTR